MIFLYGASGHGKVIAEIIELQGQNIDGFLDDYSSLETLMDYPVYPLKQLVNLLDVNLIISIGSNLIRKKVAASLNCNFISAIHPNTNISRRVHIGEGTAVMAGVTINSSCKIGKHVIVNTNASVDHDCILEDYVHLSPNVALAGSVQVGEGTHIGIGACVIQGISIGKWCIIGAGAVIIKNIPDGCTVVGNPGRIIKNKVD